MDHEITSPYFTTACSPEFLADVRAFINVNIVQAAVKYRTAYGMPGALNALPARASRVGTASFAQIAVVNNKTKVTDSQIRAFLQLCWTKYVKAKVEPGSSRAPSFSSE